MSGSESAVKCLLMQLQGCDGKREVPLAVGFPVVADGPSRGPTIMSLGAKALGTVLLEQE